MTEGTARTMTDEKTLVDEMRNMAVEWEECYDSGTIYAKTAATFARKWAKELEDHYVELPTDAKGEPWHVGDTCEFWNRSSLPSCGKVSSLYLDKNGWRINGNSVGMYIRPKSPADRLREWARRARADEHMDLRELDRIADAMDGGDE